MEIEDAPNSSCKESSSLNKPEQSIIKGSIAAKNITLQSLYSIFGYLAEAIMKTVPIFLVAKYSDRDHLAALGLGNALLLVIIETFTYGFSTGLTKLVSVSYGNMNYYTVGMHLNRALVANTGFFIVQLCIIFIGCSYLHGYPNLITIFKVESEVEQLAYKYMIIMLFATFGKVQFETIRSYLAGMNIYWVHTGILCIAAVIQVIATYFLVVKLDAGLIGAAIASNIAYLLAIFIIFRYLKAKRYSMLHPNTWHRFNEDSMKFLGQYIRQGWKIAFMNTISVTSAKAILLYASWIDQKHFCAYIIITACTSILIQIPLGIGTASHNLVSLALQYNHFSKARKYTWISIMGGVACGCLCAILFYIFRELIAHLNTSETEIFKTFIALSPYVLLHQILDFTQTVQFGVLRGLGSTIFTVAGSSIFMVFIGIPLPYYFCFVLRDEDFRGALIGQFIAILIIVLVCSVKILLKMQKLRYYEKNSSRIASSSNNDSYMLLPKITI